jgi:hypothetical protein
MSTLSTLCPIQRKRCRLDQTTLQGLSWVSLILKKVLFPFAVSSLCLNKASSF